MQWPSRRNNVKKNVPNRSSAREFGPASARVKNPDDDAARPSKCLEQTIRRPKVWFLCCAQSQSQSAHRSEEKVGRCGGSSHQGVVSQEHHGSRTRARVGLIAVSTRSRPHGVARGRGLQTPCPRVAQEVPSEFPTFCNCESVAGHSRRVAAGEDFMDVRNRWGVDENGVVDRPSRRRVARMFIVSRRVTCWGFRGVRVGEASNPGPFSSDDEPLIHPQFLMRWLML